MFSWGIEIDQLSWNGLTCNIFYNLNVYEILKYQKNIKIPKSTLFPEGY